MIREMLVSDIDEVMEIEEVSFSDAWNYDHFVYEILFNPYASIWVLENEESEIVGFADLWIMFERAEIANIAIRKDQQGRGWAIN